MSSHSVIAQPGGHGRFVWNDLHPAALWTIIERDGIDVARSKLFDERGGWSWIEPDATAATYEAHAPLYSDPNRFQRVDGYGLLHLDVPIDAYNGIGDLDESIDRFYFLGDTSLDIWRNGQRAMTLDYHTCSRTPSWRAFDRARYGLAQPTWPTEIPA